LYLKIASPQCQAHLQLLIKVLEFLAANKLAIFPARLCMRYLKEKFSDPSVKI
jgi:hypothetical protein